MNGVYSAQHCVQLHVPPIFRCNFWLLKKFTIFFILYLVKKNCRQKFWYTCINNSQKKSSFIRKYHKKPEMTNNMIIYTCNHTACSICINLLYMHIYMYIPPRGGAGQHLEVSTFCLNVANINAFFVSECSH